MRARTYNMEIKISNSNWTEWSTIQGVIGRVISKSAEREAHDVCNCTIKAEIRPTDDQSDSRILI